MDVSKAKNIIIILLAAFNIFLLVNNLIFTNAQSVSRETLENAEAILEQRGITLECDIPVKAGDTHRLEYDDKEGLDRDAIAAALLGGKYEVKDDTVYFGSEKEISFSSGTKFIYRDNKVAPGVSNDFNENKASEAAYKFMKEKGLISGKYVLDRYEKNGGSLVLYYIEKHEDRLLFDNYFIIELNAHGVMRLEYQKFKLKGFSAEIIDQPEAYQTLLSYFRKDRDITITSIDIGYKLMDEASEEAPVSKDPLPVWRVMIKGEPEPIYITPHDISL